MEIIWSLISSKEDADAIRGHSGHGPEWNPSRSLREQHLWDEHAVFMDALTYEGFVFLGGPLGTKAGALLVIDAEDEHTITSHLDADPWSSGGLLQTGMIKPWTILLGDKSLVANQEHSSPR